MPRDGGEIGPSEKKVRRKRANLQLMPTGLSPASANTDNVVVSPRKRRTRRPLSSSPAMSGASRSIGHNNPPPDIHEVVKELVSLQKRRKFSITEIGKSERAVESLIASTMGFRLDATEKDRKAVYARAKAFRLGVERSGESLAPHDTQKMVALSALIPLITISATNRAPWRELRATVESEMRKQARNLPVYEFAQSVRGFGDLGLACLTAEAGIPIGEYKSVSAVWKRMGLAVIDGQRQQRCRDKEKADFHRYSPRRRAEVWAFCSDSMFRAQWSAANEETGTPAGPKGHYGEVYAQRRAVTNIRIAETEHLATKDPMKWTKGRCHNDARRIMSKALLRDLWRVWRGLPPRGFGERDPTEFEAKCPPSP